MDKGTFHCSRNLEKLLKDCNGSFIDDGVVLFLGAGVNEGKVDTWEQLLENLASIAFSEMGMADKKLVLPTLGAFKKSFDLYTQASILSAHFGIKRMRAEIARLLSKPGATFLESAGLLRAVKEICGKGVVRAVVTLNYDDWLERVFAAEQSLPFVSIDCIDGIRETTRKPGQLKSQPLPVYHLHGHISTKRSLSLDQHRNFVLTQKDYLDMFSHNEGEATSTALHLLRSHPAIFIGCSLNDWNILRLLSKGRGRHRRYCLARMYCPEDFREPNPCTPMPSVSECVGLGRLRATLWESFGIEAVYFNEYGDIKQALIQLAAELEKAASKT